MPPAEFYDLSEKEYLLLRKGRMNVMRMFEQYHRRGAWIVGETVNRTWGGKGITQFMDDWWPFGDRKVQVLITERLTEIREIGRKGAIELATNSHIREAIKKHGRFKNSNRR